MAFYAELVICTAGSILYLFLLTLFAGLRRRRTFEIVLFQCGLAVFFIFSGRLLELNTQMHYAAPPFLALQLGRILALAGVFFLSPLLVHAHTAYWQRAETQAPRGLEFLSAIFYFGTAGLLGAAGYGALTGAAANSNYATLALLLPYWVAAAFLACAAMEGLFSRRAANAQLSRLHILLAVALVALAVGALLSSRLNLVYLLALLFPGALLGYYVLHHRFLSLGVQRNLVFSVTAAFLALLYLTAVRRLGDWLEPYFPPVATTSVMLFVLVIFFEPIQRVVSRVLQRAFRQQAEQLQRLTAEIQNAARNGDVAALVESAEPRIGETLGGLGSVAIVLRGGPARRTLAAGREHRVPLRRGAEEIGELRATFSGQTLSGETAAALDYLAEQLPAAIDLCRLLEEKLQLERELAERERLALLGQMAASISHNLRNPLGSMKLLLQLQLENPELPESIRKDFQLMTGEVDRLNGKLTQLLHFAKPAQPAGELSALHPLDAAAIAARTVELLRHEAERKHVTLEFANRSDGARALATEEALGDVLANLIGNALEAAPERGHVHVELARRSDGLQLTVSDDGPGIPPEARERIFEPFFTTKARGTGLGLAIVERRASELGGSIVCESPVQDGCGTRFVVTLRSA